MTAKEKLIDYGYEDVKLLSYYTFDDALIGVIHDNRVVYDYNKMIEWLINYDHCNEDEAADWIDYNTRKEIGCLGEDSPIILY